MKIIDKALRKFNSFIGYKGNMPTNENEYNELLNDSLRYLDNRNSVFEGTAPSWSAIQNKVAELEQEEQAKIDAKASALAKLSALGLTEEEVQAIIK
jgi:hypothetical protein